MLRRIPRLLKLSAIAAVLMAVGLTIVQSWSSAGPEWSQTQWGPLGPADRDLLVRVRLAGLWEQPTSQQAAQQASSAAVQEIGRTIATQHGQLDEEVRQVADQLGVPLPTTPNEQQLQWMAEISAATGTNYDRLYVQRLRAAHGVVLPLIAEVRATTRNELVRQFAATADQFVSGHIQHLESTGLVDYAELPEPTGTPGQAADLLVPGMVVLAAVLAAAGLVVLLRRQAAARQPRGAANGLSLPAAEIPRPRLAPETLSGTHRLTGLGETSGPRHSLRSPQEDG